MDFIFDAHLDLSMNAMEWNRDLRQTVSTVRRREEGMDDKYDRGKGTVSFPSMREGKVYICGATLISRYVKEGNPLPGWHSAEQAWAHVQGQLAWYRAMEECGELQAITNLLELENHLERSEQDENNFPIGYVLTMEGADSILSLTHLEDLYEEGLRAIGLSHFGPGSYAWGTGRDGGITANGRELLSKMEQQNMILDVTHLSEQSFFEALDIFHGPVWASHNNCRKFVDHPRQFTDEQIKKLITRNAVIGVALDAWMLVPGWISGRSDVHEKGVNLSQVVDNIDHICQMAGNSNHVGIGSDLDGAFGTEQCPPEINTIADLQKIPALLMKRGYNENDIARIMNGNFIRFLQKAWE